MARHGTANFKIPTTTPHQHDVIWRENVNREFKINQFHQAPHPKDVGRPHPSQQASTLITGNAPANGGPDRMSADAAAPRARNVGESFYDIQKRSLQSPYETTSHHFNSGPHRESVARAVGGASFAGKPTPYGLALAGGRARGGGASLTAI